MSEATHVIRVATTSRPRAIIASAMLVVVASGLLGTPRAHAGEPVGTAGITPQRGCIVGICGHVVNLLDSQSVLVQLDSEYRWVRPRSGSGGGDVDKVFVPKGCSFAVLRDFVPVTWGYGGHRIHTGEFVVVHGASCLG
ncbi:hypothetical protein FKR81_20555 [Lentzea tibetensis]|uniref:Uncharacterized protein n=1 Tax=Lentzea tibetensis TaxID=2591470 RepID=A0A563ESB7_9PSEU|nr:hypothetical protein [Lentzea tibetensis]TWP50559.1 hypothetical protein FKR81_20555 [Lentzea tibetensis]